MEQQREEKQVASKYEEIHEIMLTTFERSSIKDTVDNRLAFLAGFNEAYKKFEKIGAPVSFETTLYKSAVIKMMLHLRMKHKRISQ